jgi:hypothetical protein
LPATSISLKEQMLRRRPVVGAHAAHGAADHLKRGIGTFQLTMFGVGSTVGTGIFFVMSQAVPEAGPGVVVSFLLAGIAAGLAAVCYAELASAVPVSGSSYSYAYTTLGEVMAVGVAACLLLEYGVATAAVAVNWSGYLNKLLSNVLGFQLPQTLSAAPWDSQPGYVNVPAVLLIAMCALLLIRGASESAKVNAIMVMIKLGVLVVFAVVAFTAFDASHLRDFAPFGVSGIGSAAGTIFFSYIGLDAVSTAGDEVNNPQKTMPRALIGALLTVTGAYVLVAVAALGAQPWQDFAGQQEAGLATILDKVTHGDRCHGGLGPGRLHPPAEARRHGVDRHAHRVHRRIRRSDYLAGARARPATGLQSPGLSRHAHPFGGSLRLHPRQPALVHLDRVQRLGVTGVDFLFRLGPPPQRAQRRDGPAGIERCPVTRAHWRAAAALAAA